MTGPFKTKEEFIQAALHMMVRDPKCEIMVIVCGRERGLEIIQSVESYLWSFGALASAEKLVDERYRATITAEETNKEEARRSAEMNEAVKAAGGKAN